MSIEQGTLLFATLVDLIGVLTWPDVVVSDMGQPSGPRAGYDLLDAMRSRGDRTPFVVYSGSDAPEHKAEARRRGAWGSTNRPDVLVELVTGALRAGTDRT